MGGSQAGMQNMMQGLDMTANSAAMKFGQGLEMAGAGMMMQALGAGRPGGGMPLQGNFTVMA
jgi:hypothetical protein